MNKINSVLDSCDSTNDILKNLLLEGKAQEWDWIRSREQIKGKGRQGRKWLSPRGGFYFSFVLSVPDERIISCVPLFVGVIALTALNHFGGNETLFIKWPNDIYMNNKKIGGILCESLIHSGKRYIIVGIGINFFHVPFEVKNQAEYYFKESTHDKDKEIRYNEFQRILIEKAQKLYKSECKSKFIKTLENFEKYSLFKKGDPIVLLRANQKIKAYWMGYSKSGAARIKSENGDIQELFSEDIHFNTTAEEDDLKVD